MSRKAHRVPVSLDSKGIEPLSESEIALILRGADDLIGTGGRRLLAKILKGSKEKRLLELELHLSPIYGALRELSLDQVMANTLLRWSSGPAAPPGKCVAGLMAS